MFTIGLLLALFFPRASDAFRKMASANRAPGRAEIFPLFSWKLTSKGGMMPPGMPSPSSGGMPDQPGSVGQEGELYFQPWKKASLKLPPGKESALLGKSRVIPILPYGQVLAPTGSDWLNIFDMKHRMLLNEGGVFGFCYYSSTQSRLALVGTLARVKERKILDDGRSFVVIEGLERFYIDEIISERPYLKGRVQLFTDYTETSGEVLDDLEQKLFRELRSNMRMMERLFPSKNFTITPTITANRPHIQTPGVRNIKMVDEATDMLRRTKFSMAVLDMLQISSTAKLALMQEHVLERRLTRFLKILTNGGRYLQEELVKKGLSAVGQGEAEVGSISGIMESTVGEDLSLLTSASEYEATNFKDGQWTQGIAMM